MKNRVAVFWSSLSFATRLFINASIVLLLGTTSLIIVSAHQEAVDAHHDLEHYLAQELKTFPEIIAENIVIGDFTTLQQTIQYYAQRPLIQNILLTINNNTRLEGHHPFNISAIPNWFTYIFHYPILKDRIPIIIGEYQYGLLEITVNALPLAYRAWQRLRQNIFILSLTVLLDFIAIALVLHIGLRPLRQLEQATAKLAEGQLQTRIPTQGSPEFRQVIMQFNKMAQNLEQAQTHLLASQQQLQQAKTAAETANQFKSRFLANISHEIRTPLNALSGMIQLLQHSPLGGQQQKQLAQMHSTLQIVLSIINNLLDLAKIEAQKLVLEKTPFRLDQWLQELLTLTANLKHAPGVILRVELDPFIPNTLSSDPLRLKQILLNLLSNALKFTAQGEVCVSLQAQRVTPASANITFAVQDTGIGIPSDQLHAIFEGFKQAGPDTARQYGGTGLGLSISQQLVQLMGGNLQVTSTCGQGSRFYFTVELARASLPLSSIIFPKTSYIPIKNTLSEKPLTGLRLLIVEDNPINQEITRDLLTLKGAHCEIVNHGQEAIARILAMPQSFDAVLMDIQMPVMDGYTATRCLRQEPHLVTLVIIAMTANALSSDRDQCLAAGMNDYISKPIDIQQLTQLLLYYCKRSVAKQADTPKIVESSTEAVIELPVILPGCLGFNIAEALARLDYETDIYFEILEKFKLYQAEARARIRQQIQQCQTEQAARELHMLKGIAGTLGADTLAYFLQSAEFMLHSQKDCTQMAALPDQLERLLDETLQKLNTLTPDLMKTTICAVYHPENNQ